MPTSEIRIVVPLNVPEARQLLVAIEQVVRLNVGDVFFVDVVAQTDRNPRR